MLEFRLEDHSYWLDGVRLPSVTTILKAEGFIDAAFYDEYSRDRGSMVHLACHLDDMGDLDESSVDPVIKPYLKAYRSFKEQSGFIASISEEPMASATYRFAGTPDKIGSFKDITCAIIDLKTGSVAPWASLQLALYQVLVGSPYKRYSLQLTKDGKYRLKEYKDRQDRAVALSAVACWWWKKINLRSIQ